MSVGCLLRGVIRLVIEGINSVIAAKAAIFHSKIVLYLITTVQTADCGLRRNDRHLNFIGRCLMPMYSILIQYDNKDGIYIAKIPELQGCMAHGSTQEDAVREVQTAMELWLETARENDITIPEPLLYAH